jgi:dTDP-4-amino-4,6-dideoxygalactose transaminase
MSGHVPYLDLRAQARSLGPELHAAVANVLDSGNYVLGEPVETFERAFAAYCGVRHAVALNSGTSALHLALLAAGVRPGDEVVTVSMTFVATVAAILYVGAVPRFVDIDPERGTMDPRLLEAALTPRTRAIIPVHLHGRVADMAPIVEIARVHGLVVIEDAAQAHGAQYGGQPAGSLGDMACFSFYPAKNLGACGEGGALVTDYDVLASRVRTLREWGQREKYIHTVHGFNFRMDAIQGAILNVKLPQLKSWTESRCQVARRYDANLLSIGLRGPQSGPPGEHVYHVYAIRAADRDRIKKELSEARIATGIHYPIPVHLQPAYAEFGHTPGDFPATESFAAETLSLPIFPELSMAQIDRVCDVLEQVTRGAHVGGT